MHSRALIFFCCLKPIADGFLGKIRPNVSGLPDVPIGNISATFPSGVK